MVDGPYSQAPKPELDLSELQPFPDPHPPAGQRGVEDVTVGEALANPNPPDLSLWDQAKETLDRIYEIADDVRGGAEFLVVTALSSLPGQRPQEPGDRSQLQLRAERIVSAAMITTLAVGAIAASRAARRTWRSHTD